MDNKDIAIRIKEIRDVLNLKQKNFARGLGLSPSFYMEKSSIVRHGMLMDFKAIMLKKEKIIAAEIGASKIGDNSTLSIDKNN